MTSSNILSEESIKHHRFLVSYRYTSYEVSDFGNFVLAQPSKDITDSSLSFSKSHIKSTLESRGIFPDAIVIMSISYLSYMSAKEFTV